MPALLDFLLLLLLRLLPSLLAKATAVAAFACLLPLERRLRFCVAFPTMPLPALPLASLLTVDPVQWPPP